MLPKRTTLVALARKHGSSLTCVTRSRNCANAFSAVARVTGFSVRPRRSRFPNVRDTVPPVPGPAPGRGPECLSPADRSAQRQRPPPGCIQNDAHFDSIATMAAVFVRRENRAQVGAVGQPLFTRQPQILF